jgi:hypothetical protein
LREPPRPIKLGGVTPPHIASIVASVFGVTPAKAPAFASIACLVVGAVAAVLGVLRARRVNSIESTPTSRIRDLRPGLRVASGTVRALGPTLTSPIGGKSCVHYRFWVEEYVSSVTTTERHQAANTGWRTVVDDQRSVAWVLDDGTGQAEVVVRDAELVLDQRTRLRSGFLHDAPPEVEQALARYGESSSGLIFNKNMRYTESVIAEGEPLFVLGTVSLDGPRPCFRAGGDVFIVSDRGEAGLLRGLRTEMWIAFAIAGIGLAGAFLAFLVAMSGR